MLKAVNTNIILDRFEKRFNFTTSRERARDFSGIVGLLPIRGES